MQVKITQKISTQVLKHLSICFLAIFIFLTYPLTSLAQSPSLLFEPDSAVIKMGSTVDIKILIDTAGNSVGGAGAKINFDQRVLSVESVNSGAIFADYPTVFYDNTGGRITVSGIVSSPSNLYKGAGTFATVTFKGISIGRAKVEFDFEKGSTTDSNIAVTAMPGDILAEVNTLEVTVEEAEAGETTESTPTITQPAPLRQQTKEKPGIIEKIKNFLGLSKDKKTQLDPYAPLTAQAPNTFRIPYSNPPLHRSLLIYENLPYFIILLILICIIALLYLIAKRRKARTSVNIVNK